MSLIDSACPQCEQTGTLSISDVLEARPLGTFSLSGANMKVSARNRPVLTCSQCAYRVAGEYSGRHAIFPPTRPIAEGERPVTS